MANDEKSDPGGAGDDDPSTGVWGATRLPPQPPDGHTRQRQGGQGMLLETIEIKNDEAFDHWHESFTQKIWTNEMKKEPVLALINADVQVIGGEDFADIVSDWLGRNITNNNLDESDTKEYLENHAVYSRPEKLSNKSQSWIFILSQVLNYIDDAKPYFAPPTGDPNSILSYQGAHIKHNEYPDPLEAYFYSIIDKFAKLDIQRDDNTVQEVGIDVFVGDPIEGAPENVLSAFDEWEYDPVHERYDQGPFPDSYNDYAVVGIFQSERLDLTPPEAEMLEEQLKLHILYVHAAAMYSRHSNFNFQDAQDRLEMSLQHPKVEMTDREPTSKPLENVDTTTRIEIDVTPDLDQNTLWFSSYQKEA